MVGSAQSLKLPFKADITITLFNRADPTRTENKYKSKHGDPVKDPEIKSTAKASTDVAAAEPRQYDDPDDRPRRPGYDDYSEMLDNMKKVKDNHEEDCVGYALPAVVSGLSPQEASVERDLSHVTACQYHNIPDPTTKTDVDMHRSKYHGRKLLPGFAMVAKPIGKLEMK